MKIDVSSVNPLHCITPALVIGCCEDAADELFIACDSALDGCLQRLTANREFTGKANTTHLIHTQGKLPAERLLLIGLGKKTDLDTNRLRQAAGHAAQALRGARIASFATALHPGGCEDAGLEAVCEGILLGSYSFDEYKTRDRDELFSFTGMTLLLPDGFTSREAESRIERTESLCRGVCLARDLVSHPGNATGIGVRLLIEYLARQS